MFLPKVTSLESSYARIFEMFQQPATGTNLSVPEDHSDVPEAAGLLKGATEGPPLTYISEGASLESFHRPLETALRGPMAGGPGLALRVRQATRPLAACNLTAVTAGPGLTGGPSILLSGAYQELAAGASAIGPVGSSSESH
jgi:hypothetical protein